MAAPGARWSGRYGLVAMWRRSVGGQGARSAIRCRNCDLGTMTHSLAEGILGVLVTHCFLRGLGWVFTVFIPKFFNLH